jgi:hypothetical protein
MPDLATTSVALHGGIAAVAERTEQNTLTFGGTWVAGDYFTVRLTNAATAAQYAFGYGEITGKVPSFALTLGDKVYVACGTTLSFSAIGNPDGFVDIVTIGATDGDDPGNGSLTPGNNFGTPENIVALANYQGKLAIINRNSTQIWAIDPDPANYQRQQTLENFGTFAPEAVRSVGMIDVMLLADSGFRSLRVRDSSNNAVVVDIGTPVDTLVQALLVTLTDAQKATCCGVVEPTSGRYWCFIPDDNGGEGVIFVLSYFPSSQIQAWSQYRPTYQDAAIPTYGTTFSAGAPTLGTIAVTGLTSGGKYAWTPGTVGTSLVVGATTYTTAVEFTSSATTGTLHGTALGTNDATIFPAQIPFVPQKFVVKDGRVYARTSDGLISFGGTDGNSYENCGVTAQTPFMDGNQPATQKLVRAIDASCRGNWTISASTDTAGGVFQEAYSKDNTTDASSYELGRIGVQMKGTHVALLLEENGTGAAIFSAVAIHDGKGESS